MIALLVVEVAPPIPSICRRSGLPNARSRNSSLVTGNASTSADWKIQHLLVPPRTQDAGTASSAEPTSISLISPRNIHRYVCESHCIHWDADVNRCVPGNIGVREGIPQQTAGYGDAVRPLDAWGTPVPGYPEKGISMSVPVYDQLRALI